MILLTKDIRFDYDVLVDHIPSPFWSLNYDKWVHFFTFFLSILEKNCRGKKRKDCTKYECLWFTSVLLVLTQKMIYNRSTNIAAFCTLLNVFTTPLRYYTIKHNSFLTSRISANHDKGFLILANRGILILLNVPLV